MYKYLKSCTYIAISHMIYIKYPFPIVNRCVDFENMTLQQLQVAIKDIRSAKFCDVRSCCTSEY